MPRTKKQSLSTNGVKIIGEVLTLPEAAAYLRLPEADVLAMIEQQDLPARRFGNEWRFFKAAIQKWLSASANANKEGIWAAAGSLRDDPFLEEMLAEIERMRGRPTSEES